MPGPGRTSVNTALIGGVETRECLSRISRLDHVEPGLAQVEADHLAQGRFVLDEQQAAVVARASVVLGLWDRELWLRGD
jgi:hypothetical protein